MLFEPGPFSFPVSRRLRVTVAVPHTWPRAHTVGNFDSRTATMTRSKKVSLLPPHKPV